MKIGSELATFLSSPVLIILGTCDAHGSPDIGRGVGTRVDSDTGLLEVVLSGWQWPRTVANVRDNGRAAITFARPNDYVTYQLKGPAQVVEPDAQALVLSLQYISQITEVLCKLGLERRLITHWLTQRDAMLLRMRIESVFVQTPGAKAGRLIASADTQ
jgi:hypothetical protein